MRNIRYILYMLFLASILIALSCTYADPLPGIYDRIGVYTNGGDMTVELSTDAKTIDITAGTETYSATTLGSNDMRLEFYATTNVMVVFDGQNVDRLYLYTNTYYNDDQYYTCDR